MNASFRQLRVTIPGLLASAIAFGGCAASGVKPDLAYFPRGSADPRVVHLKSFNDLYDLVAPPASWTSAFVGLPASPFAAKPTGIAYRGGVLYVCDLQARALHAWNLATGDASERTGSNTVRLVTPVAVAVDDTNRVYVADRGRNAVVAIHHDATLEWKPPDRDAFKPVALTAHGDRLYVADIATHAIDVFSIPGGEHLTTIGTVGDGSGELYYPTGVAVDAAGRVYVSDMMNARVQVFTPDGDLVRAIGRPGNRYGDMGAPKHVTIAPDGTVLVADAGFAHVQLFTPEGRLLTLVGGPEDAPGATPMPLGVTATAQLPDNIAALVPPDFDPGYFFFTTNTAGRHRIALYAVGAPHR